MTPVAASPLSVAGRLLRCFALWFVAAALVLWLGTGLVWLSLERAVLIAAACTLAMAFAGL
jgi:hypothetical protein